MIGPRACGSVPDQSKNAWSPSRQIVSFILNGPLPRPSSSIQSSNDCGTSGMARLISVRIASCVRSSRAWRPARYVSFPKRSHSSITRFSPARQPATIANRSARFISGRRTLLKISFSTSSCGTPRSMILIGGMMIPSSKIVFAPVGREPGSGPPASIMMPELRGPADQLVLEEDRHQHKPVVRVRDRRGALERVRREDHVARVHPAVPGLHHLVDVGAELPDDHPATRVGDHRELVVLLPDHGAHRRAEEHCVHLVAGALQRTLDDVECDRVDLDVGDLCDPELLSGCHLSLAQSLGVIRRLKFASTLAR